MEAQRQRIQAQWLSPTIGLTIFFLHSLQNLLIPALEAAAQEFQFDEMEKEQKLGATLAFAYFVVRIPLTVICGCTMDFDYINRVRLLQIAVLIAAVSCVSTFFAVTYKELLTCRIFTGIGVSAATSVAISILFDVYDSHKEVVVTAAFLSVTAGIAFGNTIAGVIDYHGDWRLPFLVACVPVFLSIVAVQIFVHNPVRGELDEFMLLMLPQELSPEPRTRSSKLKRLPSYEILDPPLNTRKPESIAPIPGNHFDEQDFTRSLSSPQGVEESAFMREQEKVKAEIRAKSKVTASQSEAGGSVISINSDDDVDDVAVVMVNNVSYLLSRYDLPVLGLLFRTSSIMLIFGQVVFNSLLWSISFVFLNDYLSSRGLTVQSASLVVVSYLMGHILGYIAGSWAGENLRHRHSRAMISIMLCASLLQLIPFLYILRTEFDTSSSQPVHFMGGWAGCLTGLNIPMNRYLLQAVTFPEDRALCMSLNLLLGDVFMSCGPLLLVAFISAIGSSCEAFCFTAAFVSVINAGLIGGLLYFFNGDAHTVQMHVVKLGKGGEMLPFYAPEEVGEEDEDEDGYGRAADETLSNISNLSMGSEGKEGSTDGNMSDNSEFLVYDDTPTKNKNSWMQGYVQ